jgi:hypothetical protein
MEEELMRVADIIRRAEVDIRRAEAAVALARREFEVLIRRAQEQAAAKENRRG